VRILVLVAVFSIALPIAAVGFKEGPYPNVTGGFGEKSCHSCHLDNPINAPGGHLELEGVPKAYAGGQAYRITIALTPAVASTPVQFNVAANASNNDDSPLGDFIYLKSARSAPAASR
jgi:hypothetical protein